MEKTTNVKSQSTDLKNVELLLVDGETSLISISQYNHSISYIERLFVSIRSDFFNLGKELFSLRESKSYLVGGYKDIYDLAKDKFNMSSTSAKNFINVYETFKNEKDELDDKFEEFNLTQLVEMLPLADDKEFCSQLSNLTVKEIRDVKQSKVKAKTISSEWDNLSSAVKTIIESVLSELKLSWQFVSFVDDNENQFPVSKELNYSIIGFGKLKFSLTENSWDFKFLIRTYYSSKGYDNYKYIELKEFKTGFKDFISETMKEIAKRNKDVKAAVIVDSEVIDANPVEKVSSKMPTLRNDATRLEFVKDIKNWKFLGTVVDDLREIKPSVICPSDSKNEFRLAVYKFKFYPHFIKIVVGHPDIADEFKNADMYQTCGTVKHSYLSSVNENTIVNLLRADKY